MRLRGLFAVAATACLVAPSAAQAQDTRPGIGVMPFTNGGSYGQEAEDFEALTVGLQQMLISELSVNSGLRLVERGRLRELMAEQNLGAEDRVDANTAAQVGRLIGARYMIMGSFIDFYGDFRMDARVVDVETSEIIKTDRARDDRDAMFGILMNLAESIPNGLDLPGLSGQDRQAQQERREANNELSPEATRAYTRALFYQDRGDTARAVELFRQIVNEFPAFTDAQEALDQIG